MFGRTKKVIIDFDTKEDRIVCIRSKIEGHEKVGTICLAAACAMGAIKPVNVKRKRKK